MSAAIKLYYSCFYSIATYCITCYGGIMLCTRRCDTLCNIQNRIMKNLFHKFFPHSNNLYKDTKILKLPEVYKLRVATYMFRVLVLNECPTIRNNLYLSYPEHDHNTRNSTDLVLPFPRVEVIRYNFRYQFVNVWNSIPVHLKQLTKVSTFKKAVMNHFLDEY